MKRVQNVRLAMITSVDHHPLIMFVTGIRLSQLCLEIDCTFRCDAIPLLLLFCCLQEVSPVTHCISATQAVA